MNPDFASSGIIELIAESGVRLFVHKDILAFQSQPFREAIEGPWKEATDHKINLSDWDEKTISRLVQFLYTGDYRYPDPTPISPPGVGQQEITNPSPEGSSTVTAVIKPVPQINRPLTPIYEYLPAHQHGPITGTAKLAEFDPAEHDFEEALIAHAKVYALAHYKSIDALQNLAVKYLIMTLSHLSPIPPDSHIPKNVINLAAYTYANTNSLSGSEEPLRRIVSQFIALSLIDLHPELEAVGLIEKGGDFAKDIMAKACRRIVAIPYSNTRFISGLRVAIGAKRGDAPSNRVREVHSSTSNLYHQNHKFKWLVPEYTTIAKDACTGFKFSQHIKGCSDNCISAYYTRYIDEDKDQRVMDKVIGVALVRSEKEVGLESVRGYDGITASFNHALVEQGEDEDEDEGGSQDYLHLVWKSVKISLV